MLTVYLPDLGRSGGGAGLVWEVEGGGEWRGMEGGGGCREEV